MIRKDLVLVDPSAFGSFDRLQATLALACNKNYTMGVDNATHSVVTKAIKAKKYDEMNDLLLEWDGSNPKFDSDYGNLLAEVAANLKRIEDTLERVTGDQKETLTKIDELLGECSPTTTKVAKGLVRTSATLHCRILSFTKAAENHFRKLRNVTMGKLREKADWVRATKSDIRNAISSGWSGRIFVWIVTITASYLVGGAHTAIGMMAPSFILMLVTNGGSLRCPYCNGKLPSWPLRHCPQCGRLLVGYG